MGRKSVKEIDNIHAVNQQNDTYASAKSAEVVLARFESEAVNKAV